MVGQSDGVGCTLKQRCWLCVEMTSVIVHQSDNVVQVEVTTLTEVKVLTLVVRQSNDVGC